MSVVLGCRSHHRRTANINLFDRLRNGHVRLRDRLLKRIQITDDDLKRHNSVFCDGCRIGGQVRAAEDRSMYFWVQCLHATIHDFRKPGVGGHVNDRNISGFKILASAAGGQDFEPQIHQTFDKRVEPLFVADTYQSSLGYGRIHIPISVDRQKEKAAGTRPPTALGSYRTSVARSSRRTPAACRS